MSSSRSTLPIKQGDNSSKNSINILLLGETGVGKSTFINSFANYVQYETIENALRSELKCLIPTQFTITDKNYEEQVVKIGCDKNEDQGIGKSSTQSTRSYEFPIDDNRKIRLIDTPGIGDCRGIDQDNLNFENVLEFVSQYDYLHGICFLLKPNVTRITAYFKFCLVHLLSRLDKSAVQNIIFIFTNSRSTLFRPSETLPILRKLLQDIRSNPPYAKVPCDYKNIFCLDNEAFRFLVALKNGFTFTREEANNYSSSWEHSVQTCRKFLGYVSGDDENSIKPHLIRNTLSVNDARRVINELCKPLADISDLIQENLSLLSKHERDLALDGQSVEEFKRKLFVPAVILHQKELAQARTVCASASCIERTVVNDKVLINYKQICHEKCGVRSVTAEKIGDIRLSLCSSMQLLFCKFCKCSFRHHMHIFYETVLEDTEEENESVALKISSTEEQIRIQKEFIAKLQTKRFEYEAERDTIAKCLAKFACFLKEHAIAIFNDAYEDYLKYIISREASLGSNANKSFIDKHVALQKQYQEEKAILESALQNTNDVNPSKITTNEVHGLISELYALKHTGEKIKELHLTQQRMRLAEIMDSQHSHLRAISRKVKSALSPIASLNRSPSFRAAKSFFENQAGTSKPQAIVKPTYSFQKAG